MQSLFVMRLQRVLIAFGLELVTHEADMKAPVEERQPPQDYQLRFRDLVSSTALLAE